MARQCCRRSIGEMRRSRCIPCEMRPSCEQVIHGKTVTDEMQKDAPTNRGCGYVADLLPMPVSFLSRLSRWATFQGCGYVLDLPATSPITPLLAHPLTHPLACPWRCLTAAPNDAHLTHRRLLVVVVLTAHDDAGRAQDDPRMHLVRARPQRRQATARQPKGRATSQTWGAVASCGPAGQPPDSRT